MLDVPPHCAQWSIKCVTETFDISRNRTALAWFREKTMNLSGECHVIFGAGPVGMSIMEELLAKGHRIRMINHRGQADMPEDVELLRGDALPIRGTIRAGSYQVCEHIWIPGHTTPRCDATDN